jgi:hypothetical protein
LLKTVLYIINNDPIYNSNFSIVFFEFNPLTKKYINISDGLIITNNNQYSTHELFNKIKWNRFAFNNNNFDIVILIINL